MTAGAQRRLGRPPAATSAETRARIITSAERCFSLHGYDKTTNKDIADHAGLTTGALYHYFDSKQTLFLTVLADRQAEIVASFTDAADRATGALAKLCAVLDRAVELHRNDEHLARFVSIAPIELDRHTEFLTPDSPAPTPYTGIIEFFTTLVAHGQATGEIDPDADTDATVQMLLATTAGLAQFAGLVLDPTMHARAMHAFKALLTGTLTNPHTADLTR